MNDLTLPPLPETEGLASLDEFRLNAHGRPT
jgi:hypothetical protein